MSRETLKPWQPIESIPRRVEVTSLRDEEDGLVLLLAPENSREPLFRMVFTEFVAYRNINESYRIRTWQGQDMSQASSLAIVEDSSWLGWLRGESGGVLEEFDVVHYAIYTNDDCVDVLAKTPPIFLEITEGLD
jgi:hypothetical protein